MPAPVPVDANQLAPNGTIADAADSLDVLLGGPAYAVAHSAHDPRGHTDIQHPNPAHYERQGASVFPGGPAGDAGIRARGLVPHPQFTRGSGSLHRGQKK